MFSAKTLVVLFLSTLSCHALNVPIQGNHEAREVDYQPMTLKVRNELADLDERDIHEDLAIEYAERGDLEQYHRHAIRTARFHGNHEIADRLEARGYPAVQDVSKCLNAAGKWSVNLDGAIPCWDATWIPEPGGPTYENTNNAMKGIITLLQHGQGKGARAGFMLLKRAHEADMAEAKKRSPGSEISHYVAPRSPDSGGKKEVGESKFLGIHIHWHWLDDVAHIICKFVVLLRLESRSTKVFV